jgi:hypothetical protein
VRIGWPAGRGTFATRGLSTAFTFVLFAVSLVLFRADSLDAAVSLLWGLVGANGVVLPEIFSWADGVGLESDWVRHWADAGLYWLLALGVVTWAFPNTQEIFRGFYDVLPYRVSELRGWRERLAWQPTTAHAVLLGLIAVVTLASLWQPTVFIYFRF